jgi:hypothetical protein
MLFIAMKAVISSLLYKHTQRPFLCGKSFYNINQALPFLMKGCDKNVYSPFQNFTPSFNNDPN